MNTRAMLLSALIAGVIMAVLSEAPFISMLNCLLCIWLWVGGILAVYFYRRFSADKPWLTALQGLGLGALAGVMGAVIGAVLNMIFAPITNAMLASVFNSIAPDAGALFDSLPIGGGITFAAGLFENLIFYTIFGALGGLLACAAIWKAPKETI